MLQSIHTTLFILLDHEIDSEAILNVKSQEDLKILLKPALFLKHRERVMEEVLKWNFME